MENSQKRIHSMALIHRKLYEGGDLSQVDFSDYVQELVDHVVSTMRTDGQTISTNRNGRCDNLNLEVVIPCGLILNEMVTNALKHTFGDREQGTLDVTFDCRDPMYVLTIADDGEGTDPERLFEGGSLGMKLVKNLAERQLDGTLEAENDDGLTLTITFPQPPGHHHDSAS